MEGRNKGIGKYVEGKVRKEKDYKISKRRDGRRENRERKYGNGN